MLASSASSDASVGSASPEPTEAPLIQRLRAREDAAYAELLQDHGGRLLATARRLLSNEQDAQDAVQEAFLSVFKAIDRFDGKSKLYTWLHRIVTNAALMKLRSRRRSPERPIEELLPTYQDDGHQTHPSQEWTETADAAAERREVRELVRRSIDKLPENYRTVLFLRDIEEVDTEETARQLGVSTGVVKTRLHRARQALRTLLDPHFRGEVA